MLQPGKMVRVYMFRCFRCREDLVVNSPEQRAAEKYAREQNWSKKETGGWHCVSCREKKPSEAELIAARAVANNSEFFARRG